MQQSITNSAAFLFDLDGVIVDTARFHFAAWRKLANHLGFDFTEHQNEQLKGVSRKESLLKIASWGGYAIAESKLEELMVLKNLWYLELIERLNPTDILPGADAFIRLAKQQGILIGLGSASKNAVVILERVELMDMFDTIVDGNIVSNSKPDPEVFLKGAKNLDIHPTKCYVFEDSTSGLEAASAAGMKSVGIGDPVTLHMANIVVPDLQNLSIQKVLQLT